MGKPFVILELDRPRKMRFGMNALITVEELTGKSLVNMDMNAIGFKDIRAIIYAGLLADDGTLTPERVGDLIDEYSDIQTVSAKLEEAFTAAFGEKK